MLFWSGQTRLSGLIWQPEARSHPNFGSQPGPVQNWSGYIFSFRTGPDWIGQVGLTGLPGHLNSPTIRHLLLVSYSHILTY